MPINLDSCIAGVFTPGNIGASSGLPPVEPTVPSLDGAAPAVWETISASDTLEAFFGELLHEAAGAADSFTSTGGAYALSVAEPAAAVDTVNLAQVFNEGVGEVALATDAPSVHEAGIFAVSVVEAATAAATPDATVVALLSISGTPVTTGIEYEHGVGSTYAGFTVTASGGATPYAYSVASGTLPSGVTLNSSTGAVSGTPAFESAGTYAGIVIRVTDNVGATANLASFTITIAFKDPYYSNTKILFDHDGADANQTFFDGSSLVTPGTPFAGVLANAQHDTGVTPLYGTSSFLFDGASALRYSDSNNWNLGSSSFTIDFTARPTSVTGNRAWIGHWAAAPGLGWNFRQTGDLASLFISTTGSDFPAAVQSAAGAVVINTWARWRVDFNGTKYRLYKNGSMIASGTTVYTGFNGTGNLAIGSESTGTAQFFIGNCRGIRLTVGTARTASDSGYTISNRAFPTS